MNLDKLKIGIWLNPDYPEQIGGGYSYYSTLIEAIDNYQFDPLLDIVYITQKKVNGLKRQQLILPQINYQPSLKKKLAIKLPFLRNQIKQAIAYEKRKLTLQTYRKFLIDHKIDLLFYSSQWWNELPDFPYIIVNWDIGHLSTYCFPELCSEKSFNLRTNIYSTVYKRALLILSESEAGKKELISFLNINEKRVKVLPIFPSKFISLPIPQTTQQQTLKKFNLIPKKYFLYPAQFWAHKNHFNLILAYREFINRFPDYKLVLTGSDQGNKQYIANLIDKLHLNEKVKILGFVSQQQLLSLYKNATALIFPSFLGPTNMPPLEAMHLGLPVVCSDLEGHREMLADAALYFKPESYQDIAAKMIELIDNYSYWQKKIADQAKKTKFTLQKTLESLNLIFKQAYYIRKNWLY